jgi:CRISPR-associated exonuclease Cas4
LTERDYAMGTFSEEDLLPLSGVQHLGFCERQWALIHIEQVWAESVLTAEGRVMHERVHSAEDESRGDLVVCRGVRLRSLRLGLSGQADVVEFHRVREGEGDGAPLPGHEGRWRPFPVEYKRGRPKSHDADKVQLCAQALSLEEAFGVRIGSGALFYGETRRRQDVEFSSELRERTERLAARMHALFREGVTPPAVQTRGCERCSLRDHCLPGMDAGRETVAKYLRRAMEEIE